MTKRKNATSRTKKVSAKEPPLVLGSLELTHQLTLRILERLHHLIRTEAIHSFDTWPADLAKDLGMSQTVICGLVEPEVRITIGTYFGVIGTLSDLKKIFETVVGGASEPTRLMAQKLVADTIARLGK